jgi:hypothetical protein
VAPFNVHCRDCELLLGERYENVNRWMDELFKKHGPRHRRFRHCWAGVREARQLFGEGGAKAAIVHIVRDCGAVPRERDYDEEAEGNLFGIVLAQAYVRNDELDASGLEKFRKAVADETHKFNTGGGHEMATSIVR